MKHALIITLMSTILVANGYAAMTVDQYITQLSLKPLSWFKQHGCNCDTKVGIQFYQGCAKNVMDAIGKASNHQSTVTQDVMDRVLTAVQKNKQCKKSASGAATTD